MFENNADLEIMGRQLLPQEAYILKSKYISAEYHTPPWKWDIDYPCEQWCPEDIETIIQSDIASHKRQKLSKHPT